VRYTIILTTYKEPKTIGKAIEQIVIPNVDIWKKLSLIIVATDNETIKSAKKSISTLPIKDRIQIIQDKGLGKPEALNLAVKTKGVSGSALILTDGDVYVSNNAIKAIINKMEETNANIVSGHPISKDNRNSKFGFYSHLFCAAADYKRNKDKKTPASGYLYAIKEWENIFPIPKDIRAEDAYISQKMLEQGYHIEYAKDATVNVMFPKNTKDWLKQKTRSLGGNVQLKKFNTKQTRSLKEDLQMALFPLQFAKNLKEYIYIMYLYPLRLYLWLKIFILNSMNKLGSGRWESIKSSKEKE